MSKWIFSVVVCGNIIAVMASLLWVAVAFQVGLQKSNSITTKYYISITFMFTDTCDPKWQSVRNSLIITSHTFSDLTFVVFIVAACAAIISNKEISCK